MVQELTKLFGPENIVSVCYNDSTMMFFVVTKEKAQKTLEIFEFEGLEYIVYFQTEDELLDAAKTLETIAYAYLLEYDADNSIEGELAIAPKLNELLTNRTIEDVRNSNLFERLLVCLLCDSIVDFAYEPEYAIDVAKAVCQVNYLRFALGNDVVSYEQFDKWLTLSNVFRNPKTGHKYKTSGQCQIEYIKYHVFETLNSHNISTDYCAL